MASPELHILIEHYLTAQLSGERQDELRKEILLPHNRAELERVMRRQYDEDAFTGMEDMRLRERIFEGILEAYKQMDSPTLDLKSATSSPPTDPDFPVATVHRVHFLKTAWFRYAAVLLLIAGAAIFLYITNKTSHQEIVQQSPADIMPGSDKAILTLAGGEQIRLDSNANLLLASKGISNNDAVIRYANPPEIPTINLLTTPRGGQYKVQLSDGTMVWLNAASSISYPTVFTEGKREVTVTGEVYFEVAPDKTKPFIVRTPVDEVQVLGTSFNVNAYADEPGVKTTLVEGIIKVGKTILKPGQAYIDGKITASNTGQDIAWKSGFISFEGRPLEQVMREIARWYDIDVVYQQGVPGVQLGGKMSRDVSLSGMIANLKAIEVHVKLQGRRLIVLPE